MQALFASSFMGHRGFYVLIADQGNQRIIVVDRKGDILWQYGTTGVAGMGPNQLNNPNSGEILENGNILIADQGNNRIIEVKPDGTLVMTLTASNNCWARRPSPAVCPTATRSSPTPATTALWKWTRPTTWSGSTSPTPAQTAIQTRSPRAVISPAQRQHHHQ